MASHSEENLDVWYNQSMEFISVFVEQWLQVTTTFKFLLKRITVDYSTEFKIKFQV